MPRIGLERANTQALAVTVTGVGLPPRTQANVTAALDRLLGLHRWLRLKRPPGYDHVRRVLRMWRPYAGLIYFHLLLDGLDRRGLVA